MRDRLVFSVTMPTNPPTFRSSRHRSQRQANAEYDAKRGSARERGYDSLWEEQSTLFKSAHPHCLGCAAIGIVEPTAVVDHVVPHKGDRSLMWDKVNWQPSCRFHHDVVKQRLERLFANGNVTAGALALDSSEAISLSISLKGEGDQIFTT